ncbi:MAG: WD40 repeat domain-containing protein [Planctomycetes bacterium]|nr:WD40 repeat domain-containing protein [Planctomycetota bacterium]
MTTERVAVPHVDLVWKAAPLPDYVTALAWSPGGDLLAAATSDGAVTVLDGATGEVRLSLPGHAGGALCVAFSADGRLLASGGQDGQARLWDPATGAPRGVLEGGGRWVEHLAWSPVADVLATTAGKTLRRWSAAGELQRSFPAHPSTLTGVAWLASRFSGREELAASHYGGVTLWGAGAEAVRRYEWKGSMVSLAVSPDRKHVACGCQDRSVHVWIAASGEDMQMSGYAVKPRELSWDARGRFLATGGGDDPTVWDFSGKGPQGTRPKVCVGLEARVADLAFHPTSTVLAAGALDGEVMLWDVTKPRRPRGGGTLGEEVSRLAWRPQGDLLAVAGAAGKVVAVRPR